MREDLSKALEKAYQPGGLYEKCLKHWNSAEIDVLFTKQQEEFKLFPDKTPADKQDEGGGNKNA